ncbi:hypothetical protein L6Q96_09265 [Candidatus Binatia bacterium]|nr:hypothetical protein [Candidatus Binatia bacterium]
MTTEIDRRLEVSRAVARIHAGVMAMVCAVLGGGGLFVATLWLVIKGGARIGEHLGLLSWYFYGYSVTWGGAFIGLFWGAVAGGIAGWIVGEVYNLVVWLRERKKIAVN